MPNANTLIPARSIHLLPVLARIMAAALLALGLVPGAASAFDGVNGVAPTLVASQSRVAAKAGPYTDARRLQIYAALDREYQRLWDRGAGAVVARARTDTFRGFPDLRIEDRDRDGLGDFFAYFPQSGSADTQEFGAFFDLAGDGSPDWLVFYGGSYPGEARGFSIAWWKHHLIDRNNDGRFDTIVLDCVDMNDNGKIEPGVTAWFFDGNFDGRIDSAQHVSGGKVTAIPVVGGRFESRVPLRSFQKMRPGAPFVKVFDEIARDIVAAM